MSPRNNAPTTVLADLTGTRQVRVIPFLSDDDPAFRCGRICKPSNARACSRAAMLSLELGPVLICMTRRGPLVLKFRTRQSPFGLSGVGVLGQQPRADVSCVPCCGEKSVCQGNVLTCLGILHQAWYVRGVCASREASHFVLVSLPASDHLPRAPRVCKTSPGQRKSNRIIAMQQWPFFFVGFLNQICKSWSRFSSSLGGFSKPNFVRTNPH